VRKIFFVTKAELIAGRLTDDEAPHKQIGHYRSVIRHGCRMTAVAWGEGAGQPAGISTLSPVAIPARAA